MYTTLYTRYYVEQNILFRDKKKISYANRLEFLGLENLHYDVKKDI